MIRTKTEQVIERPAADIWAYAADIVRHPEWMNVIDPRLMRGTGADAGSRGRERLALGPFKWDVEFEVAEAVPGRRIVWRSVSGAPFDIEISLDLDARGTDEHARFLRCGDRAAWALAVATAVARRGGQGRTGTGAATPEGESRAIRGIRRGDILSRERVEMLKDFPIHATAAAVDLDRARQWYEDGLGLVPEKQDEGGVWYGFAGDTWLF